MYFAMLRMSQRWMLIFVDSDISKEPLPLICNAQNPPKMMQAEYNHVRYEGKNYGAQPNTQRNKIHIAVSRNTFDDFYASNLRLR